MTHNGRQFEDVKHDTREAEDVLDVAVAIAEADGEIEPEERKVLEEIAGVLGLRLENSSRQYFPTSRQHAGFAAVLPRTVSAFYPHPVSPPA